MMALYRQVLLGIAVALADPLLNNAAIYAILLMNNQPMFERMSQAVATRLQSGGKVLDLASGPGEPTVTLAAMDTNLQIVCTDIQAQMVEKAKSRAAAASVATNITFAVTPGDDLSQWENNTFDAVTMSYGLMFISDKAKSLREIYRVLKPGGVAYTSVWKSLTFYSFARNAIDEVAKKTMPEFGINPMKLKDPKAVEDLAEAAGFDINADEIVKYAFQMGSPRDTADGLTILAGAMLDELVESGDEGARTRFYEVVARETQQRGWQHGGQVTIPDNAAQMLAMRKPALTRDEL